MSKEEVDSIIAEVKSLMQQVVIQQTLILSAIQDLKEHLAKTVD